MYILLALSESEGGGLPLKLVCPVNFMNIRRSLRSSSNPTDLKRLTGSKSFPIEMPLTDSIPRSRDCASAIALATSCVALSSSYREFASENAKFESQ